ncbi:uncharacterized protein LOC111268147 isoform X2 [Varroa jacobsoni]|uniref:uncharacterized protein LOC111268147 isoform X2 n=1 Tax=Varroa jacobsoni TaxID=62625 RepID=UPI000BF72686|nr:uncharacterized protein LOC111268147 isoform X2 [Varroa jacobsoni]
MDPLRMLREYNSALVTVANATARTGATVEDNIRSEAVSYGLSDSPKAQRGAQSVAPAATVTPTLFARDGSYESY